MPAKRFQFRADARQSILRGASILADAVRVTLGPKSKSVLIEKKFGRPIVCDDGVTIAKEVELKNPEENLGAQMVREAAERTGEAVGDGTTTSTLLAHAILAEGVRNVAAGASAVDLKRGLTRGLKAAVDSIRALSRPVTNKREKAQVATISAHNNSIVGDMVAEAVEKVGAEGAITVEESKTTETVLEIVEGMQFDRGFISPYFVTDPEGMEAALDEPLILDSREEDQQREGPAAASGADRASGQTLADHLRRRRGRGSGDAGPEQDPRNASLRGGESSGIRRQAQGDATGYRHTHRRPADRRRTGDQTGKRHDGAARQGQARSDGQGHHDHRRRSRRKIGHRWALPGASQADRGDHLGLRQGETAGASGEVDWRSRRDSCRRAFRGRGQETEGGLRRRDQRDEGCHCRRCTSWRRSAPSTGD